jgi:hypothetical protein
MIADVDQLGMATGTDDPQLMNIDVQVVRRELPRAGRAADIPTNPDDRGAGDEVGDEKNVLRMWGRRRI